MTAAAAPGTDPRAAVPLLSQLRRRQDDPWPSYEGLRELGSVVPAPWGWLITGWEACSRVLREEDTWRSPDAAWRTAQGASRWTRPASRELGHALITLNPPEHSRQRRALGGMFGRQTLDGLRATVTRVSGAALDAVEADWEAGAADWTRLVADVVPAATITEFLGLPAADHRQLVEDARQESYAQELFPSSRQLDQADRAVDRLARYFDAVVAYRRRTPGDDVVSRWLAAWDQVEADRAAADTVVRRLASIVTTASIETTASLLSTAAWLLATHPDQAAWLARHPQHIPAAIEEMLRYDPSIHCVARVAARDTALDGVHIAAGQLVYALVAAAGRDPQRIDHPDQFDVRRRAPAHLAFGLGRHYCLGAGLARLEATVVVGQLLERSPRIRIVSAAREPRVAFRRFTTLQITRGRGEQ